MHRRRRNRTCERFRNSAVSSTPPRRTTTTRNRRRRKSMSTPWKTYHLRSGTKSGVSAARFRPAMSMSFIARFGTAEIGTVLINPAGIRWTNGTFRKWRREIGSTRGRHARAVQRDGPKRDCKDIRMMANVVDKIHYGQGLGSKAEHVQMSYR